MSQACESCNLTGQLVELQRENRELRQIIRRLQRIIQQAILVAGRYITAWERIQAGGGKARGTWSLYKGGGKAASAIVRVLRGS